MTKWSFMSIAGATVTSLFLSGAAEAQEYKWRIQSNVQAGEPGYVALERFAENVEDMSGGRMTFQVFPVDAIYPVADGLDAIGGGIVEAGLLTGAIYTGQIGPFGTLETGVPGSLRSPIERYSFFYEAGFLELCQEAFAPFGIHYLGPQLSSGWDLVSTKPINGPEDFDGLRIRSYGVEAEWFTSMGASTVFFGGGEIYTNLATGVVDAARWASPAGNYNNSFQEVAKYYIQPSSIAAPNNFFAVNTGAWESLTEDLKAVLAEAAKVSSLDYVSLAGMKDAQALNKMQEAGMEVIMIDPSVWSEMEAKAREFWRAYADEDDLAKRGVEMLDAFLVELGRS
ncbi:TRAP transporter substrate-binding protein DctP [Roseovarius pacificus]|uniref:TRAP transporter substrate-binding protein DctP n=1 Tax=Roseovarius pacificus TaxID=337701 RepID=UPI002A18A45D|nr:TRAP transporter substrate-binding protein DctP [Roseovarius pacificus]